MEQRGAHGFAICQKGYAARQQPGRRSEGGGRPDPVARRRRGCEPARSGWSSAPSPGGADGSALSGPLRKVSPTEPVMLRSWVLRVVPPARLVRPAPANGTATVKRTASIAFGPCTSIATFWPTRRTRCTRRLPPIIRHRLYRHDLRRDRQGEHQEVWGASDEEATDSSTVEHSLARSDTTPHTF